jgi:hypothetical protein
MQAPQGTTNQAPPTPNALELLEQAEHDLLDLQRRRCTLEAFVAELDRVSRGKVSKFWNDSVWLMVQDTHRTLGVLLASWARSIYGTGELLGVHERIPRRDGSSRGRAERWE